MKQGHYTETELNNIFLSSLSKDSVTVIDVDHLIHLVYSNEDYYVMIRSVSYAGNPHPADRFRAQLSQISYLEKYKNNGGIFLFLGYDQVSGVYVLWNPYRTRQRINVKASVSLFCEQSVLLQAKNEGMSWGKLKTGEQYVAFRIDYLEPILGSLSRFPQEPIVCISKVKDACIQKMLEEDLSYVEIINYCLESKKEEHPEWGYLEWRNFVDSVKKSN